MDGDFTLNKMGWYTVQNVEPNEYLNERLGSDQYGIYYSVKFTGDAATHLWQAKTAPKEGDKVYGHIEATSSGKATRFKRAKKEDTPQEQQTIGGNARAANQSVDDSIARAVALKAAVERNAGHDVADSEILQTADRFLVWLKGNPVKPTPVLRTNPATTASLTPKQADKAEDEEIRSLYESSSIEAGEQYE